MTPLARLLDIIAQAPQIVEDSKALGDAGADRLEKHLVMLRRCRDLDAGLQEFYDSLESNAATALYWRRSSTSFPAIPDLETDLFPVCFQFKDLSTAQLLMFFWAVQGMLWKGMTDLDHGIAELIRDTHSSLAQSELNDISTSRALEHGRDYGSTAMKVFQSFAYCTQEEMLGSGPAITLAPLSLSYGSVKDDSRYCAEARWAEKAISFLSQKHLRYAKHTMKISGPHLDDIL